MRQNPVMNWFRFSANSQSNFKSDFEDRYNNATQKIGKKIKKFREVQKLAQKRMDVRHSVKNAKRVHRRKRGKITGTRKYKSLTKTKEAQWDRISKKSIAGKKQTKNDSKEIQSTKMMRVWELQKDFGFSMKDAWARVRMEMEL